VEPGRAISGPAGVTLYRVISVKKGLTRTYVAVDGGMSDSPRHSLYGAPYQVRMIGRESRAGTRGFHVVGHHCEAHLRPPRFWGGQRESRTWFTRAHAVFCEAYLRELAQAGAGACRSGIPARAALFEAAALLKIASRRVRHLNGPRPGELAGVLGEIDVCLRRFGREQTRL
jgi:hypothetical protein